MNAYLNVDGLHFTVQGKHLLKDIRLHLLQGELVVLLGCNGAGKSTLLKHIAGELGKDHIQIFGVPLKNQTDKTLALKRAVLPQSTPMPFAYKVREVVMLGRIPHQKRQQESPLDHQIVAKCLNKVGLAGCEERNCLTLSGGELQRVHLARVLAQLDSAGNEKILLLDEPTSSLDLAHQHQTLKLARELSRTGVGVLAVLHDLNLAAQYADRLIVLKDGQVLAHGTPTEVLKPEILQDAFGHPVQVIEHPILACPLVISAH